MAFGKRAKRIQRNYRETDELVFDGEHLLTLDGHHLLGTRGNVGTEIHGSPIHQYWTQNSRVRSRARGIGRYGSSILDHSVHSSQTVKKGYLVQLLIRTYVCNMVRACSH